MAYSFAQLEGLWIQAGGNKALAPVMAAIALAESSGNPAAHNPSGATGLWQILGAVDPYDQPHLTDPVVNAKEAVMKYNTQGLGAWQTYTQGTYRQFLPAGSIAPAQVAGLTSKTGGTAAGGGPVLTSPLDIINSIGQDIGKLLAGGSGSIAGDVTSIAKGFAALTQVTYTILNDALWLFKPSNWIRILAFFFGVGLLVPTVWLLGKASHGEGDISLALGILLAVVSGFLLWVAFHPFADEPKSIAALVWDISKEIRRNSPPITSSAGTGSAP